MERDPFSAKNQTLQILQSIYFTYDVGIISSYSNRISGIVFGLTVLVATSFHCLFYLVL